MRLRTALSRTRLTITRRACYHDDASFGFRKRREVALADYTSSQLENRTKNAALLRYVDSMRTHGHRAARIDPLDLLQRDDVAALSPARYGLTDPGNKYPIDGIVWTHPDASSEEWPLSRIAAHLNAVYVGNIAYEFMHSPSKAERLWFSHLLESAERPRPHPTEQKRIWELMARSEVFDQYLQLKFPNLKRYGLEGGESMLPALDALFSAASGKGVEHIVLAMPHRGRLNLLTDLLHYPPVALFHKIKGGSEIPEDLGYSGDVVSHLASYPVLQYGEPQRSLKVSLLPNPSHLEAADPVALGKTRAKQFSLIKEADPSCSLGDKVMCVQLHGDASFTGQGVVMEALGLSNLPHYTSGGSVHLVVNNNIGYTTPASSARSSLYCSDIGKMINAPVLHVNGDYPEDVCRAMEIAMAYRNAFRKDIVVDLLVYRRWGHNELDEPAFTQPQMYQKIRSRKSVPILYEEKLLNEEVISDKDASDVRASHKAFLDAELAKVDSYKPERIEPGGKWSGMVIPISDNAVRDPETGISEETLKKVGRASVEVPEQFEIHPRLKRHINARLKNIEAGSGLDWATAEAMAFGSLMLENHDVRISGQDVGRGTFSQRHAMFVDQKSEDVTVPLNAVLPAENGRLELANSSLSEVAVLGFEYGMSWERPNLLPIWEAQFGDFFNGAQVIFDTFIASAETKWLMQSGLVVLLPHGLDGAGPEHSSMRIERMLQLTNDSYDLPSGNGHARNINMHVAFPTTPAQYFHLLRRQMLRNYRRPLIISGPKALLRLPAAASALADMTLGTRFQPVLDDSTLVNPASVERVILLTGKLYYDLNKIRENLGNGLADRVALVRIEELAPFPFAAVRFVLSKYNNAQELYWVQEEARNQGAWSHVEPRLRAVLADMKSTLQVKYIGRKEDAVPAVGVGKLYRAQQDEVLEAAFADL